MLKKIKTGVDRPLLISKLKKKFNFSKLYQKFFFSSSKPIVVYLRPFLSFLLFLEFWKQLLIYFGHKHVETGANYSYELL